MRYKEKNLNFIKQYLGKKTYKEIAELFNKEFGTNKKLHNIKTAVYRNSEKIGYKVGKAGFQPNHKLTALPIGVKRVDDWGYIKIKISHNKDKNKRWQLYHHYIWEKANGKIPHNHVVIFMNGDNRDFRLENLRCVDRRVCLKLKQNNMAYDDSELLETAMNINALLLKQNELIRECLR